MLRRFQMKMAMQWFTQSRNGTRVIMWLTVQPGTLLTAKTGGGVRNAGRPCYIMLHFIALCRFCVAYKLKVGGSPASNKSISAISPTACVHFVLSCHFLVILTIFHTFSLLLYLLCWSVISDLWCYYCKKIKTHWRLRWQLAFLAIEYF